MDKVTAFIIRDGPAGPELLILQHPYAGLQLPAGTVEPDESLPQAALREAQEESGLSALEIVRELGIEELDLRSMQRAIMSRTQTVYARPDPTGFDWASIRSGLWVDVLRRVPGWAHVRFTEWDVWPNPSYATFEITGWLPDDAISEVQRRAFYLIRPIAPTPERWITFNDHHRFTLFWAPLSDLPPLVAVQQEWLDRFRDQLSA